MLPSETLKPANSMIASLGTGMHALSSVMRRNTPGNPSASMTFVAASTIGLKMSAGTAGQHYTRFGVPPKGEPVARLKDPVYRRRAEQFFADAVLAAAAFALAFVLRFLDVPFGIPGRYVTMLAESVAVVAIGKSIVFEILGLHRKWWRYFQLPDLWPVVRAAAVASALLIAVFTLAKPYAYNLPRSVVVFDFLLTVAFVGGARLARRTLAERPDRALPRGTRPTLL